MAYTIVELQTDEYGTTITPPNKVEADKNVAISQWHETCSYAAISSVYMHVVLLISERGAIIRQDEFNHVPPVTNPVNSVVDTDVEIDDNEEPLSNIDDNEEPVSDDGDEIR